MVLEVNDTRNIFGNIFYKKYGKINDEMCIERKFYMKDDNLHSLKVLDSQYKLIRNLRKKRIENKLSQNDVAKITGLSQQAISRMEKFKCLPTLPNLINYMEAIGIDINDLFDD